MCPVNSVGDRGLRDTIGKENVLTKLAKGAVSDFGGTTRYHFRGSESLATEQV